MKRFSLVCSYLLVIGGYAGDGKKQHPVQWDLLRILFCRRNCL